MHWRACQGCPYIVQIIDVYENTINSQKVLLVVMELMDGGELFAKISERSTPFTEQGFNKLILIEINLLFNLILNRGS